VILAEPTFLSAKVQREVRDSDVADQHRRVLGMSLDAIVAEARAKHPDRSADLVELIARARLETSMSAFDVLTPPNPDYMQVISSIGVPALLVTSENGIISPGVSGVLQSLFEAGRSLPNRCAARADA